MGKILLVEDDKSLREIYGVRLQAEGYEIVSVDNGETALASAISEQPDLIISDVMMPRISGFEMLDLLRGNDKTKNIKVIMMTALSSDNQKERGRVLGADRYLVKSQVGIEDLVAVVHQVLGDSVKKTQVEQSSPNDLANLNTLSPTNTGENFTNQTSSATNNYPQIQYDSANSQNSTSTSASNYPASNSFSPSYPAPNQSPINPLSATAPSQFIGSSAPQLPNAPMEIPIVMNDNSTDNQSTVSESPNQFDSNVSKNNIIQNPNVVGNFQQQDSNAIIESQPKQSYQPSQQLAPIPEPIAKNTSSVRQDQTTDNPDYPTNQSIINQRTFLNSNPEDINFSAATNQTSQNLTTEIGRDTRNTIAPQNQNSAAIDIDSLLATSDTNAIDNSGMFPNQN